MTLHTALMNLGVGAYTFEGEMPSSEAEFRAGFRLIVDGEEVVPEELPVSWAALSKEMDALKAEEGESAKRAGINAERARRLATGTAFTVSWSDTPVPVTGREFDQTVILALSQRAAAYKAAAVAEPKLTYRDAANVIHHLTPDQFIELADLAMNWVEAVMDVSWAMKDGGIPDDFTDDKHWPA